MTVCYNKLWKLLIDKNMKKKDLRLATEEAERKGLTLDVVPKVLADFRELEEKGLGEEGSQALIKHYVHEKN